MRKLVMDFTPDYRLSFCLQDATPAHAGIMDLDAAEQSNRKGLARTKTAAFAFLLLAGALLVASLLTVPQGPPGPYDGAPGTTASNR
jgi:hypothetical protein